MRKLFLDRRLSVCVAALPIGKGEEDELITLIVCWALYWHFICIICQLWFINKCGLFYLALITYLS